MACNTPVFQYPQLPATPQNPGGITIPPAAGNSTYAQTDPWSQSIPMNDVQSTPPALFSVLPLSSGIPANEYRSDTLTQSIYTSAFLRSIIGSPVRVEFLIGDHTTERVGFLREVGANYILLDSPDSSASILGDLLSVKFVTILRPPAGAAMYSSFGQQQ